MLFSYTILIQSAPSLIIIIIFYTTISDARIIPISVKTMGIFCKVPAEAEQTQFG